MAIADLTPEYLHSLFSYDPHEGILRWKVSRSNRIHVGEAAGTSRPDGYVRVHVNGKLYYAYRIIWTMVTGAWPKEDIDHINGTPSDNRFCNLREASRAFNLQNQRRPRSDNALGILGVSSHGKHFRAQIYVDKKPVFIGTFATPELARAAYLEAKRRLHRGNTL